MTQFELGEKLNYSDKAISKWERAEAIPDAYILKQLSELFHVTVDSILSEQTGMENKAAVPEHNNRPTIMKIAIVGVWTLAILVFVILCLFHRLEWLVLVYTVPISLIVLLVLSSLWGNRRNNFFIISALVWSVIASIYLTFLAFNWWLLFVLGVPSQIIIYLSFKLHRKK
jgi:DNA-binding XRE family transcriptional regulator